MHRDNLLRDGYIAERSRRDLGLAVNCTLAARATGRRLVQVMAAVGFASLTEEWWHCSYDVPNSARFDLVIR